MTVKEMSQLYYLNREIVQLERQLEELECLAESTTQVITGMPHGSGTSDKVGRFAVRIADLRSMIDNRKARCWDEMNRLNAYIDGGGQPYTADTDLTVRQRPQLAAGCR